MSSDKCVQVKKELLCGRRRFLKGSTALAAGAVSARGAFSVKDKRPNILLIMPDQMRGDCLSVLNHPAVSTPCIDSLAENGVLFRRGYATVPSCIPARYAFLTGHYPQTSGVVGFAAKPIQTETLPGLLTESGYKTVLVGRNMHQVEESGSCGYQKEILGSTYIDKDEYDLFLRKAAPKTGGIRALVDSMSVTYNFWQGEPWPLNDALHPTQWVIDRSKEVLQSSPLEEPLFLTSSFYAPHPPLFPPEEHFNTYLESELPEPWIGDWAGWETLSPSGNRSGTRIRLEGRMLREAQAGYYGLITHLDESIASLIDAFKERSRRAGRPWVVVFTSDHGEMLGDHGYFRKCEPYEGSANVPFIVCGSPELGIEQGTTRSEPVCLEDIMPTLLAFAGVRCPGHVDGKDLGPLLRGSSMPLREQLHFEHSPIYSREQGFHALTDGRYKYIWRPDSGNEQLFDLHKDPCECEDLASSSDPLRIKLLESWRMRLVRRLQNRPEGFSDGEKLIPGRVYEALNEGMPQSA